jgi:hypothetical protein
VDIGESESITYRRGMLRFTGENSFSICSDTNGMNFQDSWTKKDLLKEFVKVGASKWAKK